MNEGENGVVSCVVALEESVSERQITVRRRRDSLGYVATRKRTTIHLDEDVAGALQKFCSEKKLVMSQVVSQGMRGWLKFIENNSNSKL